MRLTRLTLSAIFAVLAASVLVVGLASRVGPLFGVEVFAVHSGSMSPAIPVGALTLVSADATSPQAGEVAAFRLSSGAVVTHRVTRVVDSDDGRFYETRGDANVTADPSLVPEPWMVGTVTLSIPFAGFLLALLGMPIGVVAILSVAGTLLTAIWLLEEVEQLDDDPNDQAAQESGMTGAHPAAGRFR